MTALLEVRGLSCSFGGVRAVDAVDLAIPQRSVFALIGPNGAGKTTTMNLLTGLAAPNAGTIRFHGRDITRLPPHRITAAGIARTFQSGRLFSRLSVLENVMAGSHHRLPGGVARAMLQPPALRRQEAELRTRALQLLQRLGIAALAEQPVTALPYGRQRLVEIARALAAGPSLLLLDEPAAGLNTREAAGLVDVIRGLLEDGITTLLIEHNMGLVMRVAQRIAVMNFGRKIAEGTPTEVCADPAVLEAYLGHGYQYA